MFGCSAVFINGNMFMGLHNDRIILRLGEKERKNFIRGDSAQIFEQLPGRKMREYVVVPENLLANIPSLKILCEKSYEYASKLKPKEKKARKKTTKG
jgi:TfoX/Sxy family transcriptional regulator of competence genes